MEDAGLYTCYGKGIEGNVTIRFKHPPIEQNNSVEDYEEKEFKNLKPENKVKNYLLL